MSTKREKTIKKRKEEGKEEILKRLKKNPIVQIACENAHIGRTTYYRWRKEDSEFAEKADKAIRGGEQLVSDMAESQLISAIKDRNMTAIIFWLKHHHPAYATKVEVTARLAEDKDKLTPEQEELISQALQLAGINEGKEETKQLTTVNKNKNHEKPKPKKEKTREDKEGPGNKSA